MADYRRILTLLLENRSYRDVVEMVGCSHRDVARVKQAIIAHGVASGEAVSDAELEEWFPDGRRRVSLEYDQPDLARVLASMRHNRHFTLLQAWRRYVEARGSGKKYGYSQFCRSEEHTSELQSRGHLVCRLLLEKKKHRQSTRSSGRGESKRTR